MKSGAERLGDRLLGSKEHGKASAGIPFGQRLIVLGIGIDPVDETFAEPFVTLRHPFNPDPVDADAGNPPSLDQRRITVLKSITACLSPLKTASATMA